MFKSGTRLSDSRMGTNTFSGTGGSMYASGSIELVAGQLKYLYSGSINYRLDAYGVFNQGALAWSNHNDARLQSTTAGTTFYCSFVYAQSEICGFDSYGNANYCNFNTMGPLYPATRIILPQYSWSGSASEEIIDFSVGGDGQPPGISENLTTCTYTALPLEHYCAITRFNKLFTWGYNGNGQLGSNSTTSRSSPVQIGSLTDWSRIDSGDLHNISLKTDGTLWAWGYGAYGQLGDGANSSRSSPVKIGNDTNWIDFSAGGVHSAGIKSDGTLWCWGYNADGALGDNSTTSRNSPVQVSGGGIWKKVVCASGKTYGIKYDNTLWAWGMNSSGELGDNSTTYRSSPVQVSGGGQWMDVAGYFSYILGIKTDGTLYTWGNKWGTTSGYASSPVQVGNKSNYRKLPRSKISNYSVPTPSNVGTPLPTYNTGLTDPTVTVVPITIDTGDAIGLAATGAFFDFYTGGGVRKIINTERNAWVLKEYSQVSSGSSDLYFISGVTTGSLVAYTGTPRSVLFTTPGTHSIVVPPGMTYMHGVCVGGGGGGASGTTDGNDGGAGGGGALAYVNNISVTPGNLVTVAVGAGGIPGGFGWTNQNGQNGGPSEISYGGTLRARANGGSGGSGTIGGQGGTVGAGTGAAGGQGGYATTTVTPGGGGAGGYSGIGGRGAGNLGAGLNGGGGGGGGGGYASGGGGVGPYVEGPSGTGYTTVNNGGQGGSFGETGKISRGRGGLYGGGGSGGNWDNANSFGTAGAGANGCVRLVFVASVKSGVRTFPIESDFT